MDDAPVLKSSAPIVQLGIRGLPDLASCMLGGGLYVLIAKTPSARFPMLAGSVASALESGVGSTVIVSANPAQFIQRIEALARIDTAGLVAAQRLQLFMLQDNFLKKMFQFGAGRFVSELEDFGIPENSYLVFDQADELLSLHDVSLAYEQVTILKEWFSKKGVTALLVFSRLTEAHSNTVNAIMDSLDGIACLGGERDGLALSFDYWQSPTSVTIAKNYQLMTLDTGLYEASAHSRGAMSRESYPPQKLLGRPFLGHEAAAPFNTKPTDARLEKYRGYLKPIDFLREIECLLDLADPKTIPCTIVVGRPAQGIAMSDIVSRFDRSSRPGELITADEQHCYICQNTDSTSIALENLHIMLGLAVGAVFNQNKLLNDRDEIRSTLGNLLHAVKQGAWPDFSSIHDVVSPVQASGTLQPRDVQRPLNHLHEARSSAPFLSTEENELAHKNVVLLDFEPAKRSSTPYARYLDSAEAPHFSSIYVKNEAEPVEEMMFDTDEDFHSPVFGKTEVPRAKRCLN